jgi:hypothetical protein
MLPHKPHRRASREITLASWNLIRAGGGLASAAAGILLLVGHVLNLGGDPEYGTVPGASSVLTAYVLLVFALGAATMRAGVFPRWAGLLLIVGDVVFGAGDLFGPAAPIVYVLGAAITGAGFVWLRLALLSGSGTSAQRPPV